MATSPALKVRFPSLHNCTCTVTQAQLPMHSVTSSACCRCCLLCSVPSSFFDYFTPSGSHKNYSLFLCSTHEFYVHHCLRWIASETGMANHLCIWDVYKDWDTHWTICFGMLCPCVLLLLYVSCCPTNMRLAPSSYSVSQPCPFDTLHRASMNFLLDEPSDCNMSCSLQCLCACNRAFAQFDHELQTHLPLNLCSCKRSQTCFSTVHTPLCCPLSSLCPT